MGRRTNAPCFGKIGDKERSAARFGQRVRDRIDAAAIGVALEDGRAIGIGIFGERCPIKCDGAQIDLQDGVGFVGRRPEHEDAFRQPLVMDDETASAIDDFSLDRTVDEDVRTFLDRQTSDQVSANMQRAMFLHNRVGRDRAANNRGAIDNQCSFDIGVVVGPYDSRRHCQRPLQQHYVLKDVCF
jgi:hypothetical protein